MAELSDPKTLWLKQFEGQADITVLNETLTIQKVKTYADMPIVDAQRNLPPQIALREVLAEGKKDGRMLALDGVAGHGRIRTIRDMGGRQSEIARCS